jgi:hypothetical protein
LSFGYPVLPVISILGMGWIIVNTIVKTQRDSLWGLIIVSIGIPIYIISNYVRKRSAIKENAARLS